MELASLSVEEARGLIARSRPEVRLNADTVDDYRAAMAGGRWLFNGSPILLSRTGVLLDGAHRLAACTEAEVPLVTLVARGLDDDVLPTIDERRRRPLAALPIVRGAAHSRAQTALVDRLIRYDDGTLLSAKKAPRDWRRLEGALRANPGIGDAIEASLLMAGSPLPEPVRSAILYMGRQVNAALTARLLETLSHPDRFDASEPGAVLRAEVERLRDLPRPAQARTEMLALSIKALNALLQHERPRRITWAPTGPGGVAEPFPRLQGYQGLATAPEDTRPGEAAPPSSAVPDGMTFVVETVDRTQAERYLASSDASDAPMRTHVDAIARDITTGRWVFNAQPLCFSRGGKLLDGHHRLLAVVAAGQPIRTLVVRGLDEGVHSTFDRYVSRTPAARHTLGDFGDVALAAAMANILRQREEHGTASRAKKATAAEVQDILDRHPRLLALRGFGRRMTAYGRASIMGYGAYVIEREDPGLAAAFLRAVETGAHLAEGHPVVALRDHLQRLRRDRATQGEQFDALMEGWRRFRAYTAGAPTPGAGGPAATRGRPQEAPPVPPRPMADQRQHALLAAFGQFAIRRAGEAAILREAARIAATGLQAPFSRILWWDGPSSALVLREGMGWRAGALGRVRVPVVTGIAAARAFGAGRPAFHPPAAGEPRGTLPAFMAEQGVQRSVDVAIPGRGGLVGVLGVDDTAPGSFTPGDAAFLEVLATLIVLALDVARQK